MVLGKTWETMRKELCEATGDHSLVADYAAGSYTDNGANKYLVQAQIFLDTRTQFEYSRGEVELTLTADTAFKVVNFVQSIASVGIKDVGGTEWTPLTFVRSVNEWHEDWVKGDGDASTGKPTHVILGRYTMDDDPTDVSAESEITQLSYAQNLGKLLTFRPVPDAAYPLRVVGQFFDVFPSEDGDITMSNWSASFPMTLLLAATFFYWTEKGNHSAAERYMQAVKTEMETQGALRAKKEMTAMDQPLQMGG